MRFPWAGALLLAAGCGGRPIAPAVPDATTYLYDCGAGMSVVVRVEPASAWVALPTKTVQLAPVSAESGARYEGDGVRLWMRGEREAILEVDGETFEACTGGRYAATSSGTSSGRAGQQPRRTPARRRRSAPCRA